MARAEASQVENGSSGSTTRSAAVSATCPPSAARACSRCPLRLSSWQTATLSPVLTGRSWRAGLGASLQPVSALVPLSIVAALGLAALGCYALSSLLVMGGRSAQWLESHRWIYPLVLVAGCGLLAWACALALWPLAAVGAAVALVALGRYLLLNV